MASPTSTRKLRVVLCILDGFGWRPGPQNERGNAIAQAAPRFYESLFAEYPHTTLRCSGPEVGLPAGQMGNSEVGHLTIGAGRVVPQELVRITQNLLSGEFNEQTPWKDFLTRVRQQGGRMHLLGLVSPGGVHSHTDHLYGIVAAAKAAGLKDIFVHAFLDGRDTDPHGGLDYMDALLKQLAEIGAGQVASVAGRYYAMDRDQRWDRVQKAWQVLVHGDGPTAADPLTAIRRSYENDVTDEFVLPTVITQDAGNPVATIEDGDGVFFWNFRADRARELTWAFNQAEFEGFERPKQPRIAYLCMTPYDQKLDVPVLFSPAPPRNGLAEVFAAHDIRNLRSAETEKYAHVTYFFNGGREDAFAGEERIMIPSPKVATYDLQPEMSAPKVAQTVAIQARSGLHDVIIVNFANGDMVGHTGDLDAAVQAVKTIDRLLAEIIPPIVESGATFLVTADHGNCEEMIAPDGSILTAHSLNPVPFVAVAKTLAGQPDALGPGPFGLADIAPTILKLLNLPIPAEMTGQPIL